MLSSPALFVDAGLDVTNPHDIFSNFNPEFTYKNLTKQVNTTQAVWVGNNGCGYTIFTFLSLFLARRYFLRSVIWQIGKCFEHANGCQYLLLCSA